MPTLACCTLLAFAPGRYAIAEVPPLPVRIFLAFNALIWLPYGVFCLLQPGYLDGAAGLAASSPTAATEIRAMYGGLQAAIGCFALTALIRTAWARPALLMLAFLCSGLLLGRLFGLVADGGISGYTAGGLGFEVANASLALLLLRRSSTA